MTDFLLAILGNMFCEWHLEKLVQRIPNLYNLCQIHKINVVILREQLLFFTKGEE